MQKSNESRRVLPGLIDIHVHLRDPGQTQKEDFYTGSCAALAGGFTTVIDMPNNLIPITTKKRLVEKMKIASRKTVCNMGFYFGSLGDNLKEFKKVNKQAFGLKLFLNHTTGNFLLDQKHLENIFLEWPKSSPILFHAEADVLPQVIEVLTKIKRKIHICHVSSKRELELIMTAKKKKLPITCGVCAHHLFLTSTDVKKLKGLGMMKPPLQSKMNQDFLWKNFKYIDVIESDHAPHTLKEKEGKAPAFGVPGLETTLPLLLTAVSQKRLTLKNVIEKCYENPRRIFKIPSYNSKVIVDLEEKYTIQNKDLITKCKWSPFDGWKVQGRVKEVYLRGKKVYDNGRILVKPGTGLVVKPYAT